MSLSEYVLWSELDHKIARLDTTRVGTGMCRGPMCFTLASPAAAHSLEQRIVQTRGRGDGGTGRDVYRECAV